VTHQGRASQEHIEDLSIKIKKQGHTKVEALDLQAKVADPSKTRRTSPFLDPSRSITILGTKERRNP